MKTSDSDKENNNRRALTTTQDRKLYYQELLNKVEDISENADLGLETAEEIGEIISETNVLETEYDISKRYQYAEETLLDSMVLSSASGILVKCIESLDVNAESYIPAEFASNIMSYCNQDGEFEADDLLKLLPDVNHLIPQAPEYNFVYGTYDLYNLPQPKQKKERQKQQKDKFERKVPEKVTNLQSEEQGIEEIIKVLYDVLTECYERNNEESIKYYDYVIDTDSFTNTVDNIFHCAFLIREGRAHLDLDNRGTPYIKPIKKRQLKQFRDEGGVNSQFISAITVSEWETFKKEGYIQKYKNRRQ
ncbi:non-structural maintenance of chromosomes element 4 homolog A-like [Zophobas morio]|uniref:non-structural maintenance of chromosomes element 4 homolog A-like n=1 Tax=Zophobas morio TaxID=2755281 RepID=UPI003083DE9A